MAYVIYKSNDTVTPFATINDNTIDNSSTSVFLIGKRKEAYGEPEQQSKLWMLENFANNTPPTNAINGQLWFNTVDQKMYVCVDENTQTFEKVSNPIVSNSAPVLSLTTGNLWYDADDAKLYVWDGSAWQLVGPQSSVPITIQDSFFLNRLTSDATISQMWVDGVTSQVLTVPNNTSWLFEITVVARRTNANGERRSWKFEGMVDNTTNTVQIDGAVATTILAQSAGTAGWIAEVVGDNSAKALRINVTGEGGKDITWNAVVRLTKVSN